MSWRMKGDESLHAGKACTNRQARPLGRTVKILLIVLGSISVGLGVLGIFLPVLPTTPFLLLASFCYMKSSPRVHSWLINHRVLGEYIYYYTKHRAIKKCTRVVALVSLWATLLFSVLLTGKLHVRLIILAFGAAVSLHLIKLKTVDDEKALLEERRKDCSPRE